MSLFPLLFPFLNSLILGICGDLFTKNLVKVVCIFNLLIMLLSSIFIANYAIIEGSFIIVLGYDWVTISHFALNWGFLFDNLSTTMLITISLVSFLVHIYSFEYMKSDENLIKFISYLSLFTLTMFLFVTADNLVQMFLGWEGVGVCSYLLINFWHMRSEANNSALKAVILNRFGDCGILISIVLAYSVFKSVDFHLIFAITPFIIFDFVIFNKLYYLSLFLILGSICKSAQILFHTWLPDAMEGPTPVSALIHAATMVTAGIFLIIRCSPIFDYFIDMKYILGILGSLTAFFAGSCGLFQNDIKKIIAYSTCSQLGYMMYACSISAYNLALFHLVTHAFFKALLFLSAGSAIHAVHGDQDIRRMGGLADFLPITYMGLLIGSLSLIGFPFLSGYYSKDLIIEGALVSSPFFHSYCFIYIYSALIFTIIYSLRLLFLAFYSKTHRSPKITLLTAHECGINILVALFILSIGSIWGGFFLFDFFSGLGTPLMVHILPTSFFQIEAEYLGWFLKQIPFICIIFITLFYFIITKVVSYFFQNFIQFLRVIQQFFLAFQFILYSYFYLNLYLTKNKWLFDKFYSIFSIFFLNKAKTLLLRTVDRGFIDYIFIGFPVYLNYIMGIRIILTQSGFILDYLFSIICIIFIFFH